MRALLKRQRWPFVLAAAIVFGGCSFVGENPTPKTAYQLVIPESADRYELGKNQQFYLGDRIGEPVLPVYPASELSRKLPEQVLCVEIDIGEDGRVFASRPLYAVAGCPTRITGPDPVFYTAAENAVSHWAFEPARLCTFPANVARNSECRGVRVKVEFVPVRLAFMFSFTQEHGPRVTGRAVSDDG